MAKTPADSTTNANTLPSMAKAAAGPEIDDLDTPSLEMPRISVDFSKYANIESLGDGEAKQKLRSWTTTCRCPEETGPGHHRARRYQASVRERVRAQDGNHAGRNFLRERRLKVKSSETDGRCFLKYEFPNRRKRPCPNIPKACANWTRRVASPFSKLAQARAKLNSAKGQYEVQRRQRKDLQEQLENACCARRKAAGRLWRRAR